ncbi:MAG: Stk1 family PASTA domain-containing Ser/Thr kinase [Actinomycetota bacterium]
MRDTLAPEAVGERYRLIARIGKGGMGEVYRARDLVLGRTVALKILPADRASRSGFIERFRAEAQAAARLSHPNVVQVHDWGATESTYFMVMEYVRGKSLRHILAARGAVAPRQAAEMVLQLLAALGAAHGQGLVHRDVKPENLLVTVEGGVKVTDFGIARAADAKSATGELLGTVAYAAPEQIRGEDVDGRCDLYAAGCVMYELLTGAPPFEGDVARVLHQHLSGRVPAPSSERAEVGAELDRIVERATQPDRVKRYASADEMRADVLGALEGLEEAPSLSELTEELTSEAAPEAHETAVGLPNRGRRRRRWWLLTVVAMALAATGFFFRPVRVPSLVGVSQARAEASLLGAGFRVKARPVFSEESEGLVAAIRPPPGRWLRRGAPVVLEVSQGPELVEIPAVTGLPQTQAEEILKQRGLLVGKVDELPAREQAGVVLRQNPEPGLLERKRTPVHLVVSKGPEIVALPDVRSKPALEAAQALAAAGLAVVGEEVFHDSEPGVVVDQSPRPDQTGGKIEKGSEVRLVVSKGPPPFPMPDLTGRSCAEAKAGLEALGLAVTVRARPPGCSSQRVLDQDPAPGATTRKGEEAIIYVG